jgi:hypothetical protein
MLTRFGYHDDSRVRRLLDRLLKDQKEDGGGHYWESSVGTLDCWEAIAAFAVVPEQDRSAKMRDSIRRGAEFYLEGQLLNEGEDYPPWRRLHYPIHYYDVLVGLDVLTSLGYAGDARLKPALELLERKRLSDGRWNIESPSDPEDFARGPGNLKHPWCPSLSK